MDTSEHSSLNLRNIKRGWAAFSLVEVTIAMAVVSFAFVSLFGLIPTGLNTFRQAMDTSVGSQIIQRVLNDAQQTDFDQLIVDKNGNPIATTGVKATRYFDDQGTEITSGSAGAIYYVNTRVMPATVMPSAGGTPPPEATNSDLATVTVQVVNNPGNQNISSDAISNLWNDSHFKIVVNSIMVSRNK